MNRPEYVTVHADGTIDNDYEMEWPGDEGPDLGNPAPLWTGGVAAPGRPLTLADLTRNNPVAGAA